MNILNIFANVSSLYFDVFTQSIVNEITVTNYTFIRKSNIFLNVNILPSLFLRTPPNPKNLTIISMSYL